MLSTLRGDSWRATESRSEMVGCARTDEGMPLVASSRRKTCAALFNDGLIAFQASQLSVNDERQARSDVRARLAREKPFGSGYCQAEFYLTSAGQRQVVTTRAMPPTIVSKKASNWVDRGEPANPTLRRFSRTTSITETKDTRHGSRSVVAVPALALARLFAIGAWTGEEPSFRAH